MKIYEKHITVRKEDLDSMNHVNNVRYVQWVQDIAEEHWIALTDKILQEKYLWVVLSHHIEYKGEALVNDIIKLKTYVANSEGVRSVRIVEMYNSQTDKLLVKAETNWCLINASTKKPLRIPQEIKDIFQ
ncbi:acyl-CoA thioesterase [Zhouia amylolytica]|uniref:acyl-CoA thioesterase n=1 Tax=Zhouia amylolytica TaxID=376730 RepID=UPI0020CE8362|nr:thioesterase family protein [Zhouia amylolytica]MCQ0110797.1 acyl-CoA thioesterase [Zhouia amylolytica]